MRRVVAVLRPEPGNAATAARAEALGMAVLRLPLFELLSLDWSVRDPQAYDALLLTSANAVRMAGTALPTLRALPVLAVGSQTAAAARAAGFDVMVTGEGDGAALLEMAQARGVTRALHLGGRERTVTVGGPVLHSIAVYASDPRPVSGAALGSLNGSVALLHSTRAAARLASLLDPAHRADICIAAISDTVAAAAGSAWAAVVHAPLPTDAALLEAAGRLIDPANGREDKAP